MAANYDIQPGGYTIEELRGGTRLAPVRVIPFITKPTGIYAETRIDLSIIDTTAIGGILQILAEGLEIVGQRHDVAAVEYQQDVNAAQQLIDVVAITVQSASGNTTETAEFLLGSVFALGANVPEKNLLTPTDPPVTIADISARLDAIEGL